MKTTFGFFLLIMCFVSHWTTAQVLSINQWKVKLLDEPYEKVNIILGKPDIKLETYTNRFVYCMIYKNRVSGKNGKKNLVLFVFSDDNRKDYVHSLFGAGKYEPVYTPNGLHYVVEEENGKFSSNNGRYSQQLDDIQNQLKKKQTQKKITVRYGKYYYKCNKKKLGEKFYIELLPNNKFKAYYEYCDGGDFINGTYYFDANNSIIRLKNKRFIEDNILYYRNKTLTPSEEKFFLFDCMGCFLITNDNSIKGVYTMDK